MIFSTLALVAPFFSPTTVDTPAKPVAIRADVIWLGQGRTVEKGVLLLSQGRIAEVGTNVDVPAGVEIVEHKGVITAGMIALHGYNGAPSEMRDDTRSALPDAKVGAAFDPNHYDFEDARAAGITTLVLTPPAEGIAPGVTAVVKSFGHSVVNDEAHLSLVFTASGLTSNREPTSLSGAVTMLDALFAKPTGAIERAADGKLPCLFEATTRPDVLRVIEFAKQHELKGAIHGVALAGELASEINAAKLAVIVPTIGVGGDRRALKSVVALAKEAVPFGFGLDAPWRNPADLRLSAALCVREGLDRKTAWNALTSEAAQIAGVADRVGRIERGLDADIVLWSGDPLDLGSRVVAVYVNGARVAGGER